MIIDRRLFEPGGDPLQRAYELRTIGAADQPLDLALVRDGTCPELGHHGLTCRCERERIRPSIAGEAFADHVVQPAQVIEDVDVLRRMAAARSPCVRPDWHRSGREPQSAQAAVDTAGPAGEGLKRHLLRQPQMTPDSPAEPTEVDFLRLGWLVLRHSLEPWGGTAGHRSSPRPATCLIACCAIRLGRMRPISRESNYLGQTNRLPWAGGRRHQPGRDDVAIPRKSSPSLARLGLDRRPFQA